MDEEMFHREFECVPTVTGLTPRVLQDEFRKIHEELTDPVKDWRLRVGAAKQIRSLLIAGAADYPDFDNQLQMLDNCFKQCLQDLRSQVVREICITIMYCSTQLGARFDHLAEALLPSLMSLVSNSAKIMSTSAIVSIYSILRNSHSARLVPLITCHLSSKSQSIRRESLGFLEVILHSWPTESLVKHSTALKSALTRGITDADAKARKHARKAFVGFVQHFKTEGDGLMVLLDRRMQKLLHSEMKQCEMQRGGRHESGESVSTANDTDDDASNSTVSKTRSKAVNFYSGKFASESGDNLDTYTPDETRVPKEKVIEPEVEHIDVVKPLSKAKRAKSVPPMPRRPRVPSPPDTRTSTVTEEDLFLQQCEDVPPVRIASARDLARRMTLIRSTLSDCTCPWEKRVEAAQNIRALLMANAAESIDFYVLLRKLEIALQLALKDTHLAVMRETSITVCFLAMRLGWRFEHCAEILLPTIVSLQLSPVKDVAMASTVTFRVIVQNTQSEKLIPVIVSNFASKYSLVRRENYKAMAEVIGNWPFNAIASQLSLIEESLTSGINDPDPSVRAEARSAFYLFTGKYAQTKTQTQTSRLRPPPHHRCLDGVAEDLDDTDSVCSNHSSQSAQRPGVSLRSVHGHSYMPSPKASYNSTEYSGDSCSSRYQKTANVDENIEEEVCRRPNMSRQRQRQLSPPSGRRQQGVEEPRNWDCRDKSPPAYNRGLPPETTASSKGNPRVTQHTFRSRPRSSIPVAQTLRCMRARSFTGDRPRLSPVLEEDSKEKEKSTAACRDIDDMSVAVQMCHSDNSITWPETLEPTPLHKTKSDENMDDIYPNAPIPTHTPCSPTHTPRDSTHSPTPLTSSPNRSPSHLTNNSTDTPTSTSHSYSSPVMPPSPHASLNLQRNETHEPTRLHKTQSDDKCTDMDDMYIRASNSTQVTSSSAPTHSSQHTRSGHTCTRQRNEPMDMETERVSVGNPKTPQYVYNETLRRDMMQMMSMLSSSSWSDRQEGLLILQNQLSCNRAFNRLELSKLTEVFTLMFHDHNERVYSLVVDTLAMLVERHYPDLGGWLYMCLTRLLTKLCTDMMLSPLKSRVEKTLNTIKSHFGSGDQFKVLLRFIVELEMQNYKLIIIVLRYISDVIQSMSGSEFCNSSDMRLATSRIIRWVSEPGSVEIRKMALDVLCSMYRMNNDEFITMLCELPRAFQESAVKMLHVDQSTLDRLGCVPLQRLMARRRRPHNRHTERPEGSCLGRPMSECTTIEDAMSVDSSALYAESAAEEMINGGKMYHTGQDMGDGSFDNEDFYDQCVSQPPKLLELIADLSVHERSDQVRLRLRDGLVKLSQKCISDDTYLPNIFNLLLQSLDDAEDKTRMLTLQAMTELQRQPHCAGAISSLSEYAHDIIEKVLQLHLEANLRVKTAAEDCAGMIVRSLPPNRTIQVLIPIVERSTNTVQLAAINMLSEAVKRLSEDDVTAILAKVIPGLLKGYDSVVGNVRKACVYCLVALHEAVGEAVLQPYLSHVSETKRKLLNVYIKRGT